MKQHLKRILACLTLWAALSGALPASASAAGFQDVPTGHWAAESIQQCVELGFFNGETATRFGVGHQMTRSAFAVVLCRFFDWETSVPAQATYQDVPTNAWYAKAIEAAYRQGAITDQRKDFRPTDPITREELAVMLVRALGYGSIAGLNQDLTIPFQDVTTNAGYIAMAYHLGLVSGTSADAFSPERFATREQVAVILMRLYNKLQNPPETLAIVSSPEELDGVSIAAIPATQLVSTSAKNAMVPDHAFAVREAACQAGIPALLHATGSSNALKDVNQTADELVAAVQTGDYDGLFLDLPKLNSSSGRSLVQLATRLNSLLGDKLLYLAVEAPARVGKNYTTYKYASLSAAVDKLVLRLPDYETFSGEFPIAPYAPPEEICYTVNTLQQQVDISKLSLMLSPSAYSAWNQDDDYDLSAEEFEALLADPETAVYSSDRYACSYLVGTVGKKELVVWYLGESDLNTRIQLAGLLGMGQVCLTE